MCSSDLHAQALINLVRPAQGQGVSCKFNLIPFNPFPASGLKRSAQAQVLAFAEILQRAGLVVSGINPRRNLVEVIELKDHPWFVATQAHPEFQSKPSKAHPLFAAFIGAALRGQRRRGTRPKRR